MSDLIPPGVVSEADVRAAQAVVDAWLGETPETLAASVPAHAHAVAMHPGALLKLRGLLAGTFSEVRAAGVLEGHRAGWAEALDTAEEAVRGALEEIR